VEEKRLFAEYMRDSLPSCVRFVKDYGKTMSNLVLVTGVHKTSSWTCAALESPDEMAWELKLKAAYGEASIWATSADPQPRLFRSHTGPRQERNENSTSNPLETTAVCVMVSLACLLAG
jgi:hypothetical protein